MTRRWAPWAALGLLMVAVLALALRSVYDFGTPTVMPDELTYAETATAIGDRLRPVLPGELWFNSYAQLHQLLLAPLYGTMGAVSAFKAAHVVQGAIFVSTAIPVFLLVRRLTSSAGAGLLAGLLTILVPWLVLAGSVLSEPAAYAATAWAVLAMHHGLVRADLRGDAIALLGIGLAFSARTQLALLGAAYVGAILVHERARPEGLRRHALVLGLAVVAGLLLVTGASRSIFGNYSVVAESQLIPGGSFGLGRDLLGAVAVGTGLLALPLAAGWGLERAITGERTPRRAFAALVLATGVVLTVGAGAYIANFAPGVHDRYLLYVVPIVVAGAVTALWDSAPRWWGAAAGALVGAWAVSSGYMEQAATTMISPGSSFRQVLDGRAHQAGSWIGLDDLALDVALPIAAIVLTAVYAGLRRSRVRAVVVRGIVAAALLLVAAGQTVYTLERFDERLSGGSPEFLAGRDAVDDLLRRGDAAALLAMVYDHPSTQQTWWSAMFFNDTVDRAYALPDSPRYDTPASYLDVAPDGLVTVPGSERALPAHIVQSTSDARIGFQGAEQVAGAGGMTVRRVPSPWRAAWLLDMSAIQAEPGLDDGAISAALSEGSVPVDCSARVLVYGDGRARRRELTLFFSTTVGAPRSYDVRVGSRRERVELGKIVGVRSRVAVPAKGTAAIPITVDDPLPGPTPAPAAGLRLIGVELGA